jgi:hypothetical protein
MNESIQLLISFLFPAREQGGCLRQGLMGKGDLPFLRGQVDLLVDQGIIESGFRRLVTVSW